MSPRRLFLAVGVAVLALALAAAAVGANPFATASNPERIDIISRATAINNFVDVGPAGPTPGDIYVFVDDVFFAKDPNQKVGEALGRCTVIDPATARFGCSINTSLPEGSIMTDGTLINVLNKTSTGPSPAARANTAMRVARVCLTLAHWKDRTQPLSG
jgi:hypothetical protein